MKRRFAYRILAAIFLFASLALGLRNFARPPVKTSEDLSAVAGKIEEFSFVDGAMQSHNYVVRLQNYPAQFVIPADFIGAFSKNRFESDLKRGDSITISFAQKDKDKLISKGARILIFAVRSSNSAYLEEHDTLPLYNSSLGIVAVVGLVFAALLLWTA
jgi:hypothetical protein